MVSGRSGDRFGQIAEGRVFDLAEIECVVQFLKQNQACTGCCCPSDIPGLCLEIGGGVARATLLDQGNRQGVGHER